MTEQEKTEKAAEVGYSAYCEAVGGKAWNGDPLPDWEEFSGDESKRKQADGWRTVAKAILGLLLVLLFAGCETLDSPIISDLADAAASVRLYNGRNVGETKGTVRVGQVNYHYYAAPGQAPAAGTPPPAVAPVGPAVEIHIGTGKARQDIEGSGGITASGSEKAPKKGVIDRGKDFLGVGGSDGSDEESSDSDPDPGGDDDSDNGSDNPEPVPE